MRRVRRARAEMKTGWMPKFVVEMVAGAGTSGLHQGDAEERPRWKPRGGTGQPGWDETVVKEPRP
jgi:hypothetical protein